MKYLTAIIKYALKKAPFVPFKLFNHCGNGHGKTN